MGPLEERACACCGEHFETVNPRRRYCSDRCRVRAFQLRQAGRSVVAESARRSGARQ